MTKLANLRTLMKQHQMDAFIVPRTDEYQNEYVPACAERLAWLTGFTGSAGTAVITAAQAALFVDGRYTLQAPQEVDTAAIQVLPSASITPLKWLADVLPPGSVVGFDAWLHPQAWLEMATAQLAAAGLKMQAVENPIDAIWTDRPAAPQARIEAHPLEFAGEPAEAKRLRIATLLKEAGAAAFAITQPDSLAWLLNIRGADVPHTPLPLGFAILHDSGTVDLFVDPAKVTPELRQHLGNAASLHEPAGFAGALRSAAAAGRLAVDAATSAAGVFAAAGHEVIRLTDPCILPKATKNATELQGTRNAHQRDGVAMVRCLAWLAAQKSGSVDELQVSDYLEQCRRTGEHFRDLSFDTIAGSGPNGAIVHYRSSPKTNRKLGAGELFLLDSGAQYRDGTTDITRTMAIGTPTAEMRDRFTRVLKGHIAIARAVFPQGTTGHQLDALARLALWQAGCDFAHGTGHGVGSYLSVHEGPQRISPRPTPLGELKPGMIVSNEPGYYKTGAYGIRIENLIAVTEASIPNAEHPMLAFETLTLCPIDRNLIETGLLLPHERDWLDTYHARVRSALLPCLETEVAHWLEVATAPI